MAAGKTKAAPIELLRHKGWRIVDPNVVCPEPETYRQYIQASKGEWSVAKNAYVIGQAGWFSCRSACYLAAGRPVVVQDTGLSNVLPVGEGLVVFNDIDSAVSAVESVEHDYQAHATSAAGIAEEYFDSASVLNSLLERTFATAGNTGSST
jgi:hypothetical protein